MKRALIAAALLTMLATTMLPGGKSNIVRHYYEDDTYKEFWASEGNCRHHLSAHPRDVVLKPGIMVNDASACN